MLDLLSRRPSLRLLLKALSKKEIHVPAYTKADGTWVPAHTKLVNYNPDHGAVLSGKSSHSHKEALKQAHKLVPGLKDLPAEHQSHIVQSHAQDIQTAASKAAQVSVFKKQLLAGQKPKGANIAAFKELLASDPQKAVAIRDSIIAAIGMDKFIDLVGPGAMDHEAAKQAAEEPKGPTADELATASAKLQEIASGAPGMSVGLQAYKKLANDPQWVAKNAVDRLQAVVDLWKQLQSAASASAKVSTFTKKLAAGKVPSPSEMEAYAALDDAGKMKAVKAAHKKSGNKLSLEQINGLLDQGAAKAGIETVDSPAMSQAAHFGEAHEGEVVGIPGKQAKFKFEGGKWNYWTGDGWGEVKAAEWIAALNAGTDVLSKQPLEVVPDPGTNFGQKHEGEVFDGGGPHLFKFEDGAWQFQLKDSKAPSWQPIANDAMVAALNKGEKYGYGGGPLESAAPQPDDGQWGYSASDPGFSGSASLTCEGPNGTTFYIVPNDPMDGGGYQVGEFDEGAEEPDFKDIPSAERVQVYLQKKGVHPPELNSILKLSNDDEPGPQEGDTKQGVGGLLTLKDGHWTLDNAAMVSFFSKHAIKPGSATAIAATMTVAYMSEGKDASSVMAQLVSTKEAAKHQGFSPAQINDLIADLNDEYSKVLAQQLESQTEAPAEAPASSSEFAYEHHLENTSEGHNKFWKVSVDPVKKTATTTWGKIGAAKPQSKTYKHSSAQAAYQAAKDAVAAKLGKGYVSKTVADGGGTSLPPPPAKPSFGKENEDKVFSSVLSTGATGFYKYSGGQWLFSFDPDNDGWDPVPVQSALHDNLEQGFAGGKKPLLDLGKKSFGAANEGKMFEATLSTGKTVVFKYENGQWHNGKDTGAGYTWVPNVSSHWIAALEQGLDINNNPLVEVASFGIGGDAQPFGPANEGKVFFSISPYGGQKALFKYTGLGVSGWQISIDDGDKWNFVAASALATNLNKGLDAHGVALKLNDEDAYGNPQAGAVDTGPHEGDVKPGKGGWLILKDGHWVKASEDEALKKLCPVPESIGSSFFKQALAGVRDNGAKWKKVATTKIGMPNVTLTIEGFGKFVGKASKGTDGVWTGWGSSMAGKNVADALNYLEHLKEAQKAIGKGKLPPDSPFAGQPAPAAPTAAPAAPKPAAAAPVAPPAPAGMDSIDGWKKVGGQGGFNEGGTYTDPQGDDWYCKFPAGGAKVARNELLANKLYEAAGLPVPEVKLVTQGGKIGLASRIVTGAKQDKAALEAGKAEGLLSGFVADAWLANWDVVGNNPAAGKGWDNIMFKQGIAYRIDPGGALLYGGAGGKKTQFGDTVIELETMRDPKVNARTAKVFGGISQADLKASAAKVLAISDSKIDQMVEQFGPGDASEKAALAKTLKARKADIAAKFPAVAKKLASQGPIVIHPHELKKNKGPKLDPKNLPVKVSDLPQPHDYMNWNGTGKPISDKPYVLQNIVDEKAIFDFAMKGNLVALKDYKYQPVDKMTGEPVGSPKPMETHPSQYVQQYYDSVVQFLEVVANPMAPLELPVAKNVSTVEQLSECFPAFKYGKNIASVPSNHRLGFWFGLGFVEDPQAVVPKVLGKPITKTAFQKAVDLWHKAPSIMRSFLEDVKGSGSANQPYRDGKVTDHGGRNCRKVLSACYDNAMEHEEGTTIYKKISMPKAMVDEFLKQPVGLVFQNPGSMCCSRKKLSGFGSHVLTIHYAKGAKANDNMGWGDGFGDVKGQKSDSEQEITSLAGARFMVMSRKMVGGDLHLELLMLPPDPTYVADLKVSA